MRGIGSISLLFLFLLNTIGGISLLMVQRYKRHEYVESILRSDAFKHHLTSIQVPSERMDEIHWVESGREFRYHGDMYDVVRSTKMDEGSILFLCLPDHKETELYGQIENNLGTSPAGHHGDRVIVLQLLKFLSGVLIPSSTDAFHNVAETAKGFHYYMPASYQVSISFPGQPPEIA